MQHLHPGGSIPGQTNSGSGSARRQYAAAVTVGVILCNINGEIGVQAEKNQVAVTDRLQLLIHHHHWLSSSAVWPQTPPTPLLRVWEEPRVRSWTPSLLIGLGAAQ